MKHTHSCRLRRFRLRTILIAVVVIGLVLSRCELKPDDGSGVILKFHGSHNTFLMKHWQSRADRDLLASFGMTEVISGYYDRTGTIHRFSALFSFKTCPCCGQSWEWDGETYVE